MLWASEKCQIKTLKCAKTILIFTYYYTNYRTLKYNNLFIERTYKIIIFIKINYHIGRYISKFFSVKFIFYH